MRGIQQCGEWGSVAERCLIPLNVSFLVAGAFSSSMYHQRGVSISDYLNFMLFRDNLRWSMDGGLWRVCDGLFVVV